MRTITIRRWMLVSVGLLATVSVAACSPHPAGNAAGSGNGKATPLAASPTQTASASRPVLVPPAGAWLAASEIPFGATYGWSLFAGNGNETPIGAAEGNGVYYVSPDTVFQAITSCGAPSLMLGTPLGARQRQFKPTSGDLLDEAGQWISTYPDDNAAQAAWQRLQAAYAACPAQEGNPQITLTETARNPDGMAWFHSTNGALVGSLAPYAHEYFVLHANEIGYVYVEGGGAALAITPNDGQVLATIARHLATPGGIQNAPSTTPATSGGVQNLVISSAVRNELTTALVDYYGISPSELVGGGALSGTVYYAYDPADDSYWAVAGFELLNTDPTSVQSDFLASDGNMMFQKASARSWLMRPGTLPFICSELQFIPPAVLTAWALPMTAPAGQTC